MAKTKKVEKQKMIKTKQKLDNSIEVEITKSPGKSTLGKIISWAICVGTICVPLAGLIYLLVVASK